MKLKMVWRVCYYYYGILLLLGQFPFSGSSVKEIKARSMEVFGPEMKQTNTVPITATQLDITTPITTVPTIIPTTSTPTSPILNPTSNPESSTPTFTTPFTTPTTLNPPVSPGKSWCIASQGASQSELQVALDYACGYGGADCAAIQPGGSCYNPINVHQHASYAFNNYYQKNPVPNSCNFAGTAVITSTDPSTKTCQYPSTSTSSSLLNATNSSGSTVFGAVPTNPNPTSPAVQSNTFPHYCIMLWLMTVLAHYYI